LKGKNIKEKPIETHTSLSSAESFKKSKYSYERK